MAKLKIGEETKSSYSKISCALELLCFKDQLVVGNLIRSVGPCDAMEYS